MKKMIVAGLLLPLLLSAQKFYEDDPLEKTPPPISVEDANKRKPNEWVDFFYNTLGAPGERHPEGGAIPSRAVNTLGEAPDSAWYENRHGRNRMTIEELVRGPGDQNAPSEGVWKVVAAKTEGVTPGFTIEDARGRRYLLKFDPLPNLELASGAEVVCTHFFHAFGYHVPENYIVYFDRSRLAVGPDAEITETGGVVRKMTDQDVDEVLARAPRDRQGRYRGMASLYLSGTPLGAFSVSRRAAR